MFTQHRVMVPTIDGMDVELKQFAHLEKCVVEFSVGVKYGSMGEAKSEHNHEERLSIGHHVTVHLTLRGARVAEYCHYN